MIHNGQVAHLYEEVDPFKSRVSLAHKMPKRGLLGNRVSRFWHCRLSGQTIMYVSQGIGRTQPYAEHVLVQPHHKNGGGASSTRVGRSGRKLPRWRPGFRLVHRDVQGVPHKERYLRGLEAVIETGGYYREIHTGRTPLYKDWTR